MWELLIGCDGGSVYIYIYIKKIYMVNRDPEGIHCPFHSCVKSSETDDWKNNPRLCHQGYLSSSLEAAHFLKKDSLVSTQTRKLPDVTVKLSQLLLK